MDATEIVTEAAQFPLELWVQIIGFSTGVGVTTGQMLKRLYERR